ncbi:MAG: NADP-dependent oxidoreductase [Chloroflexi bacterium]|nr:MAG: NADP-dependent oxidoreductase [Chloroflexota bacterium]
MAIRSATTNRQFRLAARPVGLPKSSDWSFVNEPVGAPREGELLVKLRYISLDPAMRGWMNEGRSYVRPVELGQVMRAAGVGEVIESRNEAFPTGAYVVGTFGVQEYAVSDGTAVYRVDPNLAPPPKFLSVLGLTGLTAYFGLLDIGRPEPGQTVVVSAACGAVGQIVGQIAKIKGCRAVGIAGGPEKCRYVVDELGFDAAVDYKREDVRDALRTHCPDRIDVYFDNVGGEILDTALTLLARHARIVLCGAISQYNETGPRHGPANYMALLVDRARMEGFLVFDFFSRYPEAIGDMAGWMAEGRLRSREDIVSGIETFPDALLRLFRGENFGKLMLEV